MSDKSGTQLSDLGLTNDQVSDLIIQRERHILNKYIYKLGEIFLPRNTMRSMLQETIINMVNIIKLLPPIVVTSGENLIQFLFLGSIRYSSLTKRKRNA